MGFFNWLRRKFFAICQAFFEISLLNLYYKKRAGDTFVSSTLFRESLNLMTLGSTAG